MVGVVRLDNLFIQYNNCPTLFIRDQQKKNIALSFSLKSGE